MKYLNTYRLFEKYTWNISDIKDMLLELNDQGYQTTALPYGYGIKVEVWRSRPFDYTDISEVIKRIHDYMDGYWPDISNIKNLPIMNPETFEVTDRRMWNVNIIFRKI